MDVGHVPAMAEIKERGHPCRGGCCAQSHPHADFMRHGLNHRFARSVSWPDSWACGDADDAVETARYTVAEADALHDPVA